MQPQDDGLKKDESKGKAEADEFKQLCNLVQLMEQFALSELIIEAGDFMVCLRRGVTSQRERYAVRQPLPVPSLQAGVPTAQTELPSELYHISSPLTGIFYRRPAPNEPPFVEVGSRVEIGQAVALVESMKVFNEVFSEASGVVVEICAQDGQLVHQGDTLIILRRTET